MAKDRAREAEAEGAGEGLGGAFTALASLLDDLVPEATGTVRDVGGREYRLPAGLSARREVVVIRHVRRALESPTAADAFGGVRGAAEAMQEGTGVGAFGRLLSVVARVADEAILAEVEQAFGAAFPEVLAEAREAASTPDVPAGDLFGLADMVAALVPFFAREARTLVRTLAPEKRPTAS